MPRLEEDYVLVCDWPHSDWTKSLICKDAFQQGFHYSEVFQRFYTVFKSEISVPCQPDAHLSTVPAVRTTYDTVRTPERPKHHPFVRHGFPSGHSSVSRSFCSSLHSSRRLSSPSGRLSVIELQIFFPSSNKGRLLQPSGRRGFPSRRAHP